MNVDVMRARLRRAGVGGSWLRRCLQSVGELVSARLLRDTSKAKHDIMSGLHT